MENMDIELHVEVDVPKKLSISAYDMTVILGNLMDNAITALDKCSGKKFFLLKSITAKAML